MIVGSRRASIVLPTPGGPTSSRWCPPAAAAASASRALARPRTSTRSSGSSGSASSGGAAGSGGSGHGASPFRHACSSPSVRATRTCTPGTSAGFRGVGGRDDHALGARARERVDERERSRDRRTAPSRPSSPSTPTPSSTPAGSPSSALGERERDRELEPGTRLAHRRRREVHRDALHRILAVRTRATRRAPARATRARPRRGGRRPCSRAGRATRAPRRSRPDRRHLRALHCSPRRARDDLLVDPRPAELPIRSVVRRS